MLILGSGMVLQCAPNWRSIEGRGCGCLEVESRLNREPMQLLEYWCDVVGEGVLFLVIIRTAEF